ncbi:MAG: glycosyltransferase, partial [Bacteroidota bacterium]
MKILMIIDSLVKGGRERRLLELVKDFRKRRHIELALVLFSRRVEYPEVHDMGVPIYYLERQPKKDPRVFFRFYQLCRKEQPDLIHSWGTMPSIYAIPTAKLLGIRLLNAIIADAPLRMGWSDSRYARARLTYPFSDFIVGNSEAGLRSYEAPAGKSKCIYNGFDFNRVKQLKDPAQVRRQLGIRTKKVVGMIGGFFDRKDYYTYVKAAELALAQHPDTTFLAIGDGPNLPACKNMVSPANRDRILFTGMLDDVESVINIFDVGVLATNARVHGEGISNAILEYMVLAKAVVATRGGGTDEIVVPKE